MERCDILIKNCQILKPDMSVSEACSVAIGQTMIQKIGPVEAMDQEFASAEVPTNKTH